MAANSSIVVPDAVSKSLAAVAAAEGFVRPRIDVEPGSSAGDGFTSSLFRCRVQEEDSSRAALQLMCKTAELPSTESFIRYSFDSEDFMYRKILPAMTEIAHLEHPLPWPKHYFSAVEGTSTPSLVVEDLQPAGFAMADRRKPLDVQHCRLALRQLARFHGAGLALKHLRPDFTKDADVVLGAITKNEQMRQAWEQVGNAVPDAGGMVKDLVSDEVYQKLNATSIKFRKNFVDIMMKPSEGPAQSIIHGDCHVNNMMFQYDKSGAVTDCKLIDFQTSRYSWMSWDLGTLILVCTDKALRAEHWDDLLRGYHREVQDTLRAAGIQDPDAVYTWDQLVDSMRTECPVGMSIAPMLLNAMYADKETAERLQKLMAEMDQTADGNAEFAEEVKKLQTPTDVKQRIADIAEDLVNWGWL